MKARLLALAIAVAALGQASALAAVPEPAPVRLLAYGDSNTWGWKPVPDGRPVPRYADDQRSPGVMQKALGRQFAVEVNGLIARTLDVDIERGVGQLQGQDHNGGRRLALSLAEAAPVDLLVLMLGTNDLADAFDRTPEQIAAGLAKIVDTARGAGASALGRGQGLHQRVLVVVPPPLGDTSRTPFKGTFGPQAIEKSHRLAAAYREAGAELGVPVFDAGAVVAHADGVDGLHLSAQAHRRLGEALAAEVRRLSAAQRAPSASER